MKTYQCIMIGHFLDYIKITKKERMEIISFISQKLVEG